MCPNIEAIGKIPLCTKNILKPILIISVGCYISCCSCNTPSRKHQLCERKGGWFLQTKRWEVTFSSEDSCRAIHVRGYTLVYLNSELKALKLWSNKHMHRCDEKALEDSLCKRVIVTPDGNITKLLDPAAATTSRDALAKTVYSRLFDW